LPSSLVCATGTQYCAAVTQDSDAQTPSQRVARRIRELRDARGWSARTLAEELGKIGYPQLNRSTVASIESGRRSYITVDELFALARVLDVSPLALAGQPDPVADLAEVRTRLDQVENRLETAQSLLYEATSVVVTCEGNPDILVPGAANALVDRVLTSGVLAADQAGMVSSVRSAMQNGIYQKLRQHADEKHGRA